MFIYTQPKEKSMRESRLTLASVAAELPIVLWLLFCGLMIPLVIMVSFSIRYSFLVAASRDAAFAASRCRTFATDVSSTKQSAIHTSKTVAETVAQQFNEISLTSVNTNIIITKLADGTVSKQSSALAQPADTSAYAYQIEVVVNGQAQPILKLEDARLQNIPGLTAPIKVSVCSKDFFENPQGLNQ